MLESNCHQFEGEIDRDILINGSDFLRGAHHDGEGFPIIPGAC